KPEMSAYEVTEALLERIEDDIYDVIILNFANCDMVGHTGFFDAAVKAVETVDKCLGKLIPAILKRDGQILLTADHGNSEKMTDAEGEPFTAHTTSPVPLIYIGGAEGIKMKEGKLADIAPTMLTLLDIDIPAEMSGEVLLADS
ncbi:MAG: alkaline phosphatase family protein, partial [Halanaerobiales bacterium]